MTLLDAALLFAGLVAVAPVATLVAKRPVWREIRAHPVATSCLSTVAVGATALALPWVLGSAVVLRSLALVAVALAIVAYVRARPDYGTMRGLPPGSLALIASLDSLWDQGFYERAASLWGPVFKMSQFHRPVICVVDLEQGLALLRTAQESLAPCPQPFQRMIPRGYLEFMSGERHAHYREILRDALTRAVTPEWERQIRQTMRAGLDRMAAAGAHGADGGVAPDAFVDDMVFACLLQAFFGVATGGECHERFRRLYDDLDHQRATWTARAALAKTAGRLMAEVRPLIDARRATTSMLCEIVPANPEDASDPTVVGNLVFMVAIARATAGGLVRWLLKMACDHPIALDRIRQMDGTRDADASEARVIHFVCETLRLAQSEYVYRRALRECRVGDVRIPRGWIVRICLRECHRRADVFPDPGAFDPDRFARRRYGNTEFCPFGEGAHACLAPTLVMTMARTFVQELACGHEWHAVSDGPIERGNRHWQHWRPSARLRVRATPIASQRRAG